MTRPLLLILCGLCALPASAARGASYEIERYIATFELAEGTADVDVTLDITYNVRSGPKSGGFKYVGDSEVDMARASDERGPIRLQVRHQRETLLEWFFDPIAKGRKRVMIRFRSRGLLAGTVPDGNRLSAPWAGVFRVPVRDAVCRVSLPGDAPRQVTTPNSSGQPCPMEEVGGRLVVTLNQSQLQAGGIDLHIEPGLVDHERVPPASREKSGNSPAFTIFVLGLVVLYSAAKRAARALGLDGDSSDDSGDVGGGGGGCGGGGCGGGGCGG